MKYPKLRRKIRKSPRGRKPFYDWELVEDLLDHYIENFGLPALNKDLIEFVYENYFDAFRQKHPDTFSNNPDFDPGEPSLNQLSDLANMKRYLFKKYYT